MEKIIEPKTPSEVLMEVLESFSSEEPDNLIIVWNTEENFCFRIAAANSSDGVGLLEVAKHMILKSRYKDEE